MRIRAAHPHEYPAIGEMTVAAYATLPGREHPAHRRYEDVLRDVAARAEWSLVLVAESHGRLLGTVTYVPGPGPGAEVDDPDAASIRMLGVAPGERGRGIGQALVEACVAEARAGRRARIVLHTREVMASAQHLYQRLGFQRRPDLDFSPVEGIDLLGYGLELN